jgi:type I restriction enzyme S subunit
MNFAPITDVCDFQGGTQPPKSEWVTKPLNGYVRMLQIRDFTQSEKTEAEYIKDTKKLKKCQADDILIGRYGASVGKILTGLAGAYNVAIVRSIPNEKILKKEFLYYLLKSPSFQNFILNVGGRAAQAGFNKTDLEKFKIPLPPLDDQKRIAHLLGKVEGLIARRKQHLQQLDDLLRSVFLEMFGDPVRNEKGWEKKTFSTLLSEIESGKSPKCEARQASPEEWGVLKLGAVTSCIFKESESKALPDDVQPQTRDEVRAGDLLFSRKNTYELVAACVYVFETRPRLLMPDLIFRFVFKDDAKINPIFIWKLLISDSQRKKIQSLAGGAAGSMPNISKANLKQVLLPIPPINLQNQFAVIVKKVEALKSRYQQSLADLEHLYGALSQTAFKGELDLSRVPLPLVGKREAVAMQEKRGVENRAEPQTIGVAW